jgi:NADH-quinone oxidoreductase subunit G
MPHYCYHNKLSIAGNCRICFVELERAVKPIVSCSTNIDVLSNKSKIFLDTPLVKKARENIMEFLLLNHPLDCPICDQGGDCDLQDQSLFFGFSKRRFYKFKRVVNDKELGPIVKTVMTRCIHCTRCVRFLSEIAESGELGMMGRGVSSEIGTYSKSLILSELSGNIVDLCPVGALTHKTFSHEIRGWDVEKRKAIDPTDNLGVPVKVLMNNSEIVMVEPYLKDDSVNYFISDKTRHFFDSISKTSGNTIANKSFKSFTNLLHKNLYLFELSDLKYQIKNYFTLLIGNLNINTLCLLSFYEQKYKFLKLQKIENKKLNNDFEYLFKFNTVKLKKSNICLFIGTNTYKESMMLNLKLKQRHSKGNFKSFIIGSTLRITFDIISVGSTLQVLKYITEGKNLICQSLSKNPFLVSFNSELFKRKDGEQVSNLLVYLNSLNNYCDLNCLNSSIYETGIFAVNNFLPLNSRDSLHFSSVYLLNVTNYSKKYLDKILQTYLIYSNTSENLKVLSLKKKFISF